MSRQYQSRLDNAKGTIKDLEAKLKGALARIKKLEDKIKKFPKVFPTQGSNLNSFLGKEFDLNRENNNAYGGGGATSIVSNSVNKNKIRDIVNELIEEGQIKTTIHDHTADDKGGDAYASKGSALQ